MNLDFQNRSRRSLRLKGYRYSTSGGYFVTICTWQREWLFGEITGGMMQLNKYGLIVLDEWLRTEIIRAEIELDTFAIMPNHFHGILTINDCRGMAVTCPRIGYPDSQQGTSSPCPYEKFGKPVPGALGTIIGHFKSIVTKQINQIRQTPGFAVWQRNYYEHIIRNEPELTRIRHYIIDNPKNWDRDPENINQ